MVLFGGFHSLLAIYCLVKQKSEKYRSSTAILFTFHASLFTYRVTTSLSLKSFTWSFRTETL
jgi:hypothetical protein